MKALIVLALCVAARAAYHTPAGFSYGFTAAAPAYGYGYARAYATPAATYAAGNAITYAAAPAVAAYAPAVRAYASPAVHAYSAPAVHAYSAPAVHAYSAPAVHAYSAPATTSSQHHSQDELGQYSYGYADVNSAKKEVKTADGVVRGSYSYVDSYGLPQKVDYVSDAYGFRVAGTNLPVAPAGHGLVGPAPVADTPAVAAAKAAHFAAHAEARARNAAAH